MCIFMSSTGPFLICLYEDNSVSVEFDNKTKDFFYINFMQFSICLLEGKTLARDAKFWPCPLMAFWSLTCIREYVYEASVQLDKD